MLYNRDNFRKEINALDIEYASLGTNIIISCFVRTMSEIEKVCLIDPIRWELYSLFDCDENYSNTELFQIYELNKSFIQEYKKKLYISAMLMQIDFKE